MNGNYYYRVSHRDIGYESQLCLKIGLVLFHIPRCTVGLIMVSRFEVNTKAKMLCMRQRQQQLQSGCQKHFALKLKTMKWYSLIRVKINSQGGSSRLQLPTTLITLQSLASTLNSQKQVRQVEQYCLCWRQCHSTRRWSPFRIRIANHI